MGFDHTTVLHGCAEGALHAKALEFHRRIDAAHSRVRAVAEPGWDSCGARVRSGGTDWRGACACISTGSHGRYRCGASRAHATLVGQTIALCGLPPSGSVGRRHKTIVCPTETSLS